MSYHVVPIVGNTGSDVRVLIVSDHDHLMVELLVAEGEPQPVVPDQRESRALDVDTRIAGYMTNTTAFTADRSREQVVTSYLDALGAADRFLAIEGQFAYRNEYSEEHRSHIDTLEEVLTEVRRAMKDLPKRPIVDVLEVARRAEQRLQLGEDALKRLQLRRLHPRVDPESQMPSDEPNAVETEQKSRSSTQRRSERRERPIEQSRQALKPRAAQPTIHIGVILNRTNIGTGYIQDQRTGEDIPYSVEELPLDERSDELEGRFVEYIVWKDNRGRKAINLRLL